MLSHTYLKVAILLLAISVTLSARYPPRKAMTRRVRAREFIRKPIPNSILHDMPLKSDLNMYIMSLLKIIQFCQANKHEIDMNFAFGLFLIKVNLEAALMHAPKNLPKKIEQSILNIVERNDELLQYFDSMVLKEQGEHSQLYKEIISLFTNDKVWLENIDKFNAAFDRRLSHKAPEQLEAAYGKWEDYVENVYNATDIPAANESDVCIASLASNPVTINDGFRVCSLNDFCYSILINGTDLGYALTHRLFLLLLSRLARGCSLISPAVDREMALRFCSSAYSEAEYIALHDLEELDLLMEQIALCSLNGHMKFLRHSWISRVLWHQRSAGCFSVATESDDLVTDLTSRRQWKMGKQTYEENKIGKDCETHLSATAAAGIAAVIRYILETQYSIDNVDNNFEDQTLFY